MGARHHGADCKQIGGPTVPIIGDPKFDKIEVNGVQLTRFDDGKVVERWGSTDELGIVNSSAAFDRTTVQSAPDSG